MSQIAFKGFFHHLFYLTGFLSDAIGIYNFPKEGMLRMHYIFLKATDEQPKIKHKFRQAFTLERFIEVKKGRTLL